MIRSGALGALLVLLLLLPRPGTAQEGAATFPGPVSLSGLLYLTYQTGQEAGADFNRFAVTRSYLTADVHVLPRLSARITMDAHQDAEGDMEVRLKYAFGKYDFGDVGDLTGLGLEGGIVHMVWLDFEEHVNLYRMLDKMFMERSDMFNSADVGLTLGGGFGKSLPEDYRRNVSSAYAARYGSFALGVYNGGGYHGAEKNLNKSLQGRLTLRPLPDVLPGLQLSGLAIVGEGNRSGTTDAEIPDWRVFNGMASYQHAGGTWTAQYVTGKGNQAGSWFEPTDETQATDYGGFAVFGEQRFGKGWRVVGGFDELERRPGDTDLSFTRVHGGLGYDLGKQNVLMVDVTRRDWADEALENDTRFQVVMQVRF